MRLPIDTSRLQFLVVAAAEPLKQFEEGKPRESWAPRVDTNGEVIWRVQLVGRAERAAGRDGPRRRDDGASVGDGGPVRHGVPGERDSRGQAARSRCREDR